MLNLMLRLFPKRFVDQMGQEWLLDTQREWKQAKNIGRIAQASWLLRTVAGNLKGAGISHIHAMRPVSEQKAALAGGGGTISFGNPEPKSVKTAWFAITMSMLGAVIAGHMLGDLFLTLWVDGKLDQMSQMVKDGTFSILFLGPLVAKVALLGLGIYLAINNRVRSTIRLFSWGHTAWIIVMFSMACSTSYFNWVLRDIGSASVGMSNMFEDYPEIKKQMGLSVEDPDWTALFLPNGQLRPEHKQATCARAEAVFQVVSPRWQRQSKQTEQVLELIMLKGISSQLWQAGCWSDAQFVEYNQTLLKTSEVGPVSARRISFQMMGQFASERSKAISAIAISRYQWCGMKAVRLSQDKALDPSKVDAFCKSIPQPNQSIHEGGRFEPTPEQVARLATVPAQ